jgi:hypothetical protein
MNRRTTLSIDALINLILAILLLLFSPKMANFFGIPYASNNFYPNILGAVLFGITIALIIEAFRNPANNNKIGLGLIGAICINLSGGFVLLLWLVFGNMSLPLKGNIFLWTLDLILLLISAIELFNVLKKNRINTSTKINASHLKTD